MALRNYLGLDVHDKGKPNVLLKANTVNHCPEPGIYIPEGSEL